MADTMREDDQRFEAEKAALEGSLKALDEKPRFQVPSVGRIVHYVLPEYVRNAGEVRPAMVVRVWGSPPSLPYPIQLGVFLDGSNDMGSNDMTGLCATSGAMSLWWKTSVVYSAEAKPGTWHWPERV